MRLTRVKRGTAIGARDLEILKFIFSSRVVLLKQIERKFFPGTHRAISAKRMRKLELCGFVKAGALLEDGMFNKYFISCDKSLEVTRPLWKFKIDKPHFKSESVDHDIRLTAIRLKLENLRSFRAIFPENLLQSSTDLENDPVLRDFVKVQSDAALVVSLDNKKQSVFSLEMELNSKGLDRYKDKLSIYYLSGNVDGVLYVCPEQSIIRCLQEADTQVRGKRNSFLYFALEKNALDEPNKITFESAIGQKVTLI